MTTALIKKNTSIILLTLLSLALLAQALVFSRASAATLSRTIVRFDRMKISTASTGTVCVNPTTTATENDVQVTFPTGYTVSTTTGDWTVNTTNLAWPTGASAWPGIGTASAAASQTVTFPSSDLTVGTLYCFNWTNGAALTIKGSATSSNTGSVTTRASGPSNIDTGDFATASITDDQIVVSATVPQTFSFALSANTDSLGNLSSSSVTSSPTPRTATVNTNAKNGWYVWAKDSNSGLNSASASALISSTTPGSNSTLSSGTEGYNTGVTSSQTSGSGTISVAAAFVGGAATGGGLDTSFRTLASSNGTANNAVLTMTNNAAISVTTPAATDYTDTITVVGAGLF
jgi:mucin-22